MQKEWASKKKPHKLSYRYEKLQYHHEKAFRNDETVSKLTSQEIETLEPCSCIHLTSYSAIIGTNKFYEIEMKQFVLEGESAANPLGASVSLDSLVPTPQSSWIRTTCRWRRPCSPPPSTASPSPSCRWPASCRRTSSCSASTVGFLWLGRGDVVACGLTSFICAAEFGVFVDAYGRRSRTEDIKWSRLPLSFGEYLLIYLAAAFCSPSETTFLSSLLQPTESPTCSSPTLTLWTSLRSKDTSLWGETNWVNWTETLISAPLHTF